MFNLGLSSHFSTHSQDKKLTTAYKLRIKLTILIHLVLLMDLFIFPPFSIQNCIIYVLNGLKNKTAPGLFYNTVFGTVPVQGVKFRGCSEGECFIVVFDMLPLATMRRLSDINE